MQLRRARARTTLPWTAAVMVVGLVAGATPAGAETAAWADGVGSASSATDPFGNGDVTQVTVSLDAATFAVTVRYVGAPVTTLTLHVDTDGDLTADHWVSLRGGDVAQWWADGPVYPYRCTTAGWSASGEVGATFPASCLGSPTTIRYSLVTNGACSQPERCDDALPYPPLATWYPALSAGGGQASAATRTLVYRLWSPAYSNAHFYTASEEEAFQVAYRPPPRTTSPWRYEGVAFSALQPENGNCTEGTPIFRFWSPVFSSHFYTANAAEKAHIVGTDRNWTYEGVAYCAYSTRTASSVPLSRFWSPRYGKHFYTADQAEADHLRTADPAWQYEGVAYYVLPGA